MHGEYFFIVYTPEAVYFGGMKIKLPLILALCGLCVFFLTKKVWAGDPAGLALGVHVGDNTGFNGKYWIDKNGAFDAMFSFVAGEDYSDIYLHADYLMHRYPSFAVEGGLLPMYVGGGLKLNVGNELKIGVRFPIGVSYLYGNNFDVFFEVAPTLDFDPAAVYMQGAIGFRFFL